MSGGSRKPLIFAPACYNLAETTRMLEIAKAVSAHQVAGQLFDIRFMSEGGEFEKLVEGEGFPIERIEPRLTETKIARIAAINDAEKLGAIYTKSEVIEKVNGDMAFLSRINPAAVVTGSYVSVPLACRVLKTPLVWTIQSTWLEPFFASGAGVTDAMRPGFLRDRANAIVFRMIQFWMWFGFIRSINQAAHHFGVTPFRPVFSYFEGDITLVAEPFGFTDIALPTNYFHIGPLVARQNFTLPESVRNIPHDLPIIFFAMGSSGVPEIVRNIVEGFRGQPYRVIAPVKPLIENLPDFSIPENVIVTGWLPALEVNKIADISVIHGGIGTVMNAAYAGKPVVGVGMQPEQVANIACLVRKGFAIRVPKTRNPSVQILAAIRTLLNDDLAKAKARAFADVMDTWDGPRNAAKLLLERYGG